MSEVLEQPAVTLKDLVIAGEKQVQLEDLVDSLEAELKEAKEKLVLQSTMVLPNMMAEVGLDSFTLASGRKIEIANVVYAKLPNDTYNAFEWLRTKNMDGVIKTQIILDVGKGEQERLKRIQDILQEVGETPIIKSTIHHMTLKALVKEQIEKGSGIPLEDFGAGLTRTSVVKN
jgi:hypothetical protein